MGFLFKISEIVIQRVNCMLNWNQERGEKTLGLVCQMTSSCRLYTGLRLMLLLGGAKNTTDGHIVSRLKHPTNRETILFLLLLIFLVTTEAKVTNSAFISDLYFKITYPSGVGKEVTNKLKMISTSRFLLCFVREGAIEWFPSPCSIDVGPQFTCSLEEKKVYQTILKKR